MTSVLSAAAAEEVDALCAIYGEEAVDASRAHADGVLAVALPAHGVTLRFLLPREYPGGAAPLLEVCLPRGAPAGGGGRGAALAAGLTAVVAAAAPGEVLLFSFLEWAREALDAEAEEAAAAQNAHAAAAAQAAPPAAPPPPPTAPPRGADAALLALVASRMRHGEPFTLMRSTFQAHVCAVHSAAEADAFYQALLDSGSALSRKLSAATHNMRAYRVETARPGVWAADCDDDGESAAGGRLLHLLTLAKARNVAVVVSRWYGGVQMGAERFKAINNAARALLEAEGFLPPPTTTTGGKR
jgi:hypothetical protein